MFYRWLHQIVETACGVRRNVRVSNKLLTFLQTCFNHLEQPSHTGIMTQMGLNAGPYHARISGLAVSFTAKLTDEEKEMQDGDIIAAAGMMWCLAKAVMPSEIMEHLESVLQEGGLPRMATRNVPAGNQYFISAITLLIIYCKYRRGLSPRLQRQGL